MGILERTIRALGVKGRKVAAVAQAVERNRTDDDVLDEDNAERLICQAISLCYQNVSDRAVCNYAGFRVNDPGSQVWIPAGRFVDLNEV